MKNQAVINKVSSPRDVVGDLLLTWPYYKKDFSLYNITTQSAEDSPQRHWGMTSFFNKKAFTLIELLVVVLIIGILAAIALPQYQKAVVKARITQPIIRADALYKASQVYYLANNTWPTDVRDLDIDVYAANAEYGKTTISGADHVGIIYNGDAAGVRCAVLFSAAVAAQTFCTDEDYAIIVKSETGKRYCRNRTHTTIGDQVCRSMAVGPAEESGEYNDYPLN